MDKKKKKPKRYAVVLGYSQGMVDGANSYVLKYVSEWPKDQFKWGARFEIASNPEQAVLFGRDAALRVASTIRMRNAAAAIIMVKEA